jgi:hypothetical protein
VSAALAQFEAAKFTSQTLVEAHHTASEAEPVDPMHEEHVEVTRRREIALLLVYRVVASLLLIESTRVVHDEHAETTAALTDFAIAVMTEVSSFPFTTDKVEKPESVTDKLVDGVVHADDEVEPAGANLPDGHAVHVVVPPAK